MKNYSYLLKPASGLLFVLCVLCFTSCKKDDATEEIPDVSVVSGTISNFSSYASAVDSVYAQDADGNMLAKCAINANGTFKIKLPDQLTSGMSLITDIFSFKPSNPNTKICIVYFTCYKKGVETKYGINYATVAQTSTSSTNTGIEYVYADSPCSINGFSSTSTTKSGVTTSDRITMDISFVKGWNQMGISLVTTTATNSVSNQLTISSKLPSVSDWIIQ